MIDPSHALAVLAQRLPRARIEHAVSPCLACKPRPERLLVDEDLFGATAQRRNPPAAVSATPAVRAGRFA